MSATLSVTGTYSSCVQLQAELQEWPTMSDLCWEVSHVIVNLSMWNPGLCMKSVVK